MFCESKKVPRKPFLQEKVSRSLLLKTLKAWPAFPDWRPAFLLAEGCGIFVGLKFSRTEKQQQQQQQQQEEEEETVGSISAKECACLIVFLYVYVYIMYSFVDRGVQSDTILAVCKLDTSSLNHRRQYTIALVSPVLSHL